MNNRTSLSSFFIKTKAEKEKKKILIFDFHNLVFRTLFVSAFAAKKQLMTDEEMYDYWKYLLINSLFNAIRNNKPSRVILAIDEGGSWRKEVYSLYKANRKEARDAAIVDFEAFWPVFNKFLDEMKQTFKNLYMMKIERCEADDIIAVITKKECGAETDITIITTDKDMVQLMKYPNVHLYDPIRRKNIKSINPERDLQIKIIAGDKSDNIPAIKKRCAGRTALKMLTEGLENYFVDPIIKSNYERNTQLVDFNCIPKEIVKNIEDQYANYKIDKIDGMKILIFLARNKINQFADNISQYLPSLRVLN